MGDDWQRDVTRALMAGDEGALARLFAEAVAALGRPGAGREWLAAVGAFDASAVTG